MAIVYPLHVVILEGVYGGRRRYRASAEVDTHELVTGWHKTRAEALKELAKLVKKCGASKL